ncbi:Protein DETOXIFICATION 47, chloroplastic [Orobanche hederae]
MAEIAKFSGLAAWLWICAPLMSLSDTAVIGQCSSIELAALGPGMVFCDYTSYVFMFLSIATSNLVATSLARKDKTRCNTRYPTCYVLDWLVAFLCFSLRGASGLGRWQVLWEQITPKS